MYLKKVLRLKLGYAYNHRAALKITWAAFWCSLPVLKIYKARIRLKIEIGLEFNQSEKRKSIQV